MATDPMSVLAQYLASQMGPAASMAGSQMNAASSIYGTNISAQIAAAQIAQAQSELYSKLQAQLILAQMQQSGTGAGIAAQLQAQQNNLSAEIWKLQTTLAEQQAQFKAQFGLDVAQFQLSKQMLEANQFANPNDWVKQAYYLHGQNAPQGGQMTGAQQVPYPTYAPSTPPPVPAMNWTPPQLNNGPATLPYNPPPVPTLGGPLPSMTGSSSTPMPGGGTPSLMPAPSLTPSLTPPQMPQGQVPNQMPAASSLTMNPQLSSGGYHASAWDDFIAGMNPQQQATWNAGHGQTPGAAGGMMPIPGGLPPGLAGLNSGSFAPPTPPPGSSPTANQNEVMVPDGAGKYTLYRWNDQEEVWEPVEDTFNPATQDAATSQPWGAYEQGKPIQVPWMQTDDGGWKPVNLEGTGLEQFGQTYYPPSQTAPVQQAQPVMQQTSSGLGQSGGWPLLQNLKMPNLLPEWMQSYMGMTKGAAGGMGCDCPMCQVAQGAAGGMQSQGGMQSLIVGERGPERLEVPSTARITPLMNPPGGPTPMYNVTPANQTAAQIMPPQTQVPQRYRITPGAAYGSPADMGYGNGSYAGSMGGGYSGNGYGYNSSALANQPWLQNLANGTDPGPFPGISKGPLSLSAIPGSPFSGMPKVPTPHQISPQLWQNMLPSEQQMALGYYRALGWYPEDVTELIRRSRPNASNASGITGWRL